MTTKDFVAETAGGQDARFYNRHTSTDMKFKTKLCRTPLNTKSRLKRSQNYTCLAKCSQ